jgi:hypothetical protein
MRKIVRVSAGRVRIRTNSVCKELEPAGAIGRLVAGVRDNARSCVMRVSIRTSSVWKELGHVGATAQPADNAYAFHLNERQAANVELRGYHENRLPNQAVEGPTAHLAGDHGPGSAPPNEKRPAVHPSGASLGASGRNRRLWHCEKIGDRSSVSAMRPPLSGMQPLSTSTAYSRAARSAAEVVGGVPRNASKAPQAVRSRAREPLPCSSARSRSRLSGWDRRRMRHFRHSRPGRSGERHGLGC